MTDDILFDTLDDDEDFDEASADNNKDENQHCTEGEDCTKAKVQQTPPHIKLEFINGQLFQKLIFAQSPNELTVRPEECVIFNDGTKSDGCSRPEFRAYVKQFHDLNNNPEAVTLFINGHVTKILPIQMKPGSLKDHLHIQIGRPSKKDGANLKVGGAKSKEEGSIEKVPPFQAHIVINNPQEGEAIEGKELKREIMQLADEDLPDTLKYIGIRFHLPIPKAEECKKMPKLDLQKFSSTWLSLSVKKINIGQHIDFKAKVNKDEHNEPMCSYEIPATVVVDELPGVHHRNQLNYHAETGLREVLQRIGGKQESVQVMGTRIAKALKKNETSWIIANIAGLYWRVKGDANRAIECLRVAVHSAPKHSKDVALLSIANVLHRAGFLNDAIVAASYSMDLSPGLVVGHFNMANLYAAKGQWDLAAMFYESTLGLQSTFEPAKQRLRLINCMRVNKLPIKE